MENDSPTPTARDVIWRSTGETLAIRLVLVDATNTSNQIADAHGAKNFARQLLGEAVSGALLLASGLKGPGTAQLRFSLSGDFTRLAADATPMGLVRAMIPKDELNRTGNFEPVMMPQTLSVRKLDREGNRISEGIVEMESLDISTSITHYLHQSEQGKALVSVVAACEPENEKLGFSGGFLLEGFPGLPEQEWQAFNRLAQSLDLTTFAQPEGGLNLGAIFRSLLGAVPAQVHQEFKVESYCPCTEEGVLRAMAGLGKAELESLFLEGEEVEVFCEFCRRRYAIGTDKVLALLNEAEENEGEKLP